MLFLEGTLKPRKRLCPARMPSTRRHRVSRPEVPKTTLSFSDSFQGLTELRKAAVLMVMIYYSERI